MRVCMIVWSYWPLATGGAEAQCRRLSHELVRQGVACSVLTARQRCGDTAREDEAGVQITRICVAQLLLNWMLARFKSKRPVACKEAGTQVAVHREGKSWGGWLSHWLNCLSFMFGAYVHLRRNKSKYDVIHVHIADWLSGYGALLGSWFNIPVVCKAANMSPLPALASWVPFRSMLDKYRRSLRFAALHSEMRDALVEQRIDPAMISIIPNGVIVPSCAADPLSGKYVVLVANFSQGAGHKGFDVLLTAWSHVVKRYPDAKLVMAGAGDSSKWVSLAKEMGIGETVSFPGYVSNHDALYGGAVMLVLPSRHEGVSNVLLEAQAWGIPAVVSDIPGSRVVVEDKQTGLIVPVGDADALAEAICWLLENPEKLNDFGRQGRRRVQEKFSIASVAYAYRKLYQEICV
jgi:glycosyltransferase involved in cell wall biosynthesis